MYLGKLSICKLCDFIYNPLIHEMDRWPINLDKIVVHTILNRKVVLN